MVSICQNNQCWLHVPDPFCCGPSQAGWRYWASYLATPGQCLNEMVVKIHWKGRARYNAVVAVVVVAVVAGGGTGG